MLAGNAREENTLNDKQWQFEHSQATDATWEQGLRQIFEYRDLGIKEATRNDYVAHVIRAKGEEDADQIHQWHYHECDFQMIYILNGWATFEYEGVGVRTLREGDCVHQVPGLRHREIECSEDVEILEIVSPADFKTVTVEDAE